MNPEGIENQFITPAAGATYDDNHPQEDGWVYIGNLAQPLQILKVATVFTFPRFYDLFYENQALQEKYNSLTDAAKNLNLKTAGLICSCCQNRNHMEKKLKSHRRAYKSEWYYEDDYEKLIKTPPTILE